MSFEEKLREAMIDYEAIADNWRTKITSINRYGMNSDMADVSVEAYLPRSRKPDYCFCLVIDLVREIILWDRSITLDLK